MVGGEVFQMWPATLSRPKDRFDPYQVDLHVPNCELFGGKFGYKKSSLTDCTPF